MQPAQISDGYTITDTIPGRGPWGPIEFTYRPALPEATYDYLETDKRSGKKRMAATLKLLFGSGTDPHVRSWDVKDKEGNMVPVSEAALRKVPAPMLDKMLDIVSGYGLAEQEEDEKN